MWDRERTWSDQAKMLTERPHGLHAQISGFSVSSGRAGGGGDVMVDDILVGCWSLSMKCERETVGEKRQRGEGNGRSVWCTNNAE